MKNLAGLLTDHPCDLDETVVCTLQREVSRGEALEEAEAVAARLRNLGVARGAGVAVQVTSGPALFATIFGIWLAGAVFVPINPRSPELEIHHALTSVRPAALLGPEGLVALDGERSFPDDAAFVTWTSGTTGLPKPIVQSHSGYAEILDRVLDSIRAGKPRDTAERPSPNLVPVSLALNAGIFNALFGLRTGAAVILMDRFVTGEFRDLVRRYQVRSTVLPPAGMIMLTEDPDVDDLSPLRFVRSITAPLSPLAARRFMTKFGLTVLNGYGQTEIGEVIGWTAADARSHPEKLGAVGRPHPGVSVKVVDESGFLAGEGEIGHLLVRPPRVATKNVDGDILSERLDSEGYFRTGDFALMDSDGFVWIEGRDSDMINRGGNKVFPDQIEEVLLLSPGVQDAAVVGRPDSRLGEVPVAFIVGEASEDELMGLCRDHLVPYKIPVAFHRVDRLPRSEVGKILRRKLVFPAGSDG